MAEPSDFDLKSEPFQQNDIERLKSMVSRYFRVYDIRWNEKTAAFYFNFYYLELEDKFEELRIKLKEEGFIPRVGKEGGEHIIYIVRSSELKKRNVWINILLIILTFITTTWAGSILWFPRVNSAESSYNIIQPLLSPESVLFGFLSFALPLMIILGTHETAHYMAAKRHNIDASLPYFIPMPPPFILGTMGAFISMREPISNKKALLDIGAAGPIAGFIVSIPILIIGFLLEGWYPVTITELPSNVFIFNDPLLIQGLRSLFASPENSLTHPTVFAGWVGLFVTALNLIPAGQLDGGHIARALFGSWAKYLSFMVIISLFMLFFITGIFIWIFFAFLILILGTSHPPPLNDISSLGGKRQAIGAFCMVLLVLCIHYAPMEEISVPDADLELEADNTSMVVAQNSSALYFVMVKNNGDEDGEIDFILKYDLELSSINISSWDTTIQAKTLDGKMIDGTKNIELKKKESILIIINVTPAQNQNYGDAIVHHLEVTLTGMRKDSKTLTLHTHVGTFDINSLMPIKPVFLGNTCKFNVTIQNLLDQNNSINLTYNLTIPLNQPQQGWTVTLTDEQIILGPKDNTTVRLNLTIPDNAIPDQRINILLKGVAEVDGTQVSDIVKLSANMKKLD